MPFLARGVLVVMHKRNQVIVSAEPSGANEAGLAFDMVNDRAEGLFEGFQGQQIVEYGRAARRKKNITGGRRGIALPQAHAQNHDLLSRRVVFKKITGLLGGAAAEGGIEKLEMPDPVRRHHFHAAVAQEQGVVRKAAHLRGFGLPRVAEM